MLIFVQEININLIQTKMVNNISKLTSVAIIAVSLFASCQSSAEKVHKAEDKLLESKNRTIAAQKNLNQVRMDSISEYQQFKRESEEKIAANEKSIAEFRARIAKEKRENRAEYEKDLAEIERKNTDLRLKLSSYQDQGSAAWSKFKNDLNNEIDEIGNAIRNIGVKK